MSEDDEPVDPETAVAELGERLGAIPPRFAPIRERIEPVGEALEPVEESLEAAETEDDLDEVEAELEPVAEELSELREAVDDVEGDLEAIREEFDELELPEDENEEDDEDGSGDDAETEDGEDDAETEDGEAEVGEDDPIAAFEADLESVEADLESVEADLEALDGELEALEGRVDDVESGVEQRRGPYAEDVIGEIDDAATEIETTRWTEEGHAELIEAVDGFLSTVDPLLGAELSLLDDGEDVPARLVASLGAAGEAVEADGLDPDDDAGVIAELLEATDGLGSDLEAATRWDDLEVREQLRREGFYDVLDHVKDFPPEWSAIKVHEKRGNVEMVTLALESFDSDFMQEHCLEALGRMGEEAAIEPVLGLAKRRDEVAITALGRIGVADDTVVQTLTNFVDSNPPLQRPTFLALGRIGAEEAVEPLVEQLTADDEDVRSWAARALGLIGDTRTIEPLSTVLAEDEDDTVRASAAWALNRIGTAEAIESVAQYADDRSYLVQVEAERASI